MLRIKPNNWEPTNYQKKVNLPQTNFDLKIISHQFRSNVNTNLKQMNKQNWTKEAKTEKSTNYQDHVLNSLAQAVAGLILNLELLTVH
jgi:hypothetical protein